MQPEAKRQPHRNRLASETSPYLLQHAHNPVEWYPWGDEALELARAMDKPILLSVGYSACHWCHVMAHESFEDPAIAQVMNERFVNIKVDREERPEIDQIYQTVCQLLTRQGGWPLTVFLTPQQEPYFAGTYFPPDQRYGRPGFKEVLVALSDAYHNARSQVADQARHIIAALGEVQGAGEPAGKIGPDILERGYSVLAGSFDSVNGGFGEAPKFPNPFNLELFLRAHARGLAPAAGQVAQACRAMRAGGIYDQLGHGFHRYSVDARWLVPHFEKMLYDNALLVPVYLAAWQATGDDEFARTAREVLDFLLTDLRDPSGGFYSTLDADSEGEEGKYYVWTPAELQGVLEPTQAALAAERWGVTSRGNFEGGATVLHLVRSPQELAAGRGWTISQVEAALEDARQALLAARAERVPPFRDEKILTAWNGLAISALARAGLLLAEPRYLQAAAEAATLLVEKLGLGGHLYRVYKDGVVKVEGYLEDYGALIVGLLDLFGATGEPGWYRRAAAHAQTVVHEFADEENGDFYMTAAGGPRLLVRPKDRHDSATPSGTSLMAHALVRLYHLSGEERYRLLADNLFRCHAEAMRSNPWGMANLICALDSYLAEPETVVICGQPDETAPLARAATERYRPNLLVCLRRPESPDGELPDLLHQKSRIGNQPAAWLCRHFACQAPITSPDELRAALGD